MTNRRTESVSYQVPISSDNQYIPLGNAAMDSRLQPYFEARRDGVPMVDVLERAERISEALTEMGLISKVEYGFNTAPDTTSGGPIWAYYREGTRIVQRNAKNKLVPRLQRVKELIAPVAGYDQLRQVRPRIIGTRAINAYAKLDWKRFSQSKFDGPDNQERRDEYRSKLAKQSKKQRELRAELGLSTDIVLPERL